MRESDLQLLARYTRQHAEDAFAEIVRRHVNLVYSAALRQVRAPQLAEEVAQSAFTDLARNARRLAADTILTAWLYQVTRRTAIDVVRREARRQLREQIATEMNAMNETADFAKYADTPDWADIEPLLDEAMSALEDTDRAAVLLRYFENKSLREVGATLGTSDDAAQKRVGRAVERLREFFAKRGLTVGASGLVAIISSNAIQAAPIGLTAAITTATSAATLSASALASTSTAGTSLLFTCMKTATTTKILVAAAAALITAGTVHYFTPEEVPTTQPKAGDEPATAVAKAVRSQAQAPPGTTGTSATPSPRTLRPTAISEAAKTGTPVYDESALKTARDKHRIFFERIRQLALMGDQLKVREILMNEYGIRLTEEEIHNLQSRGEKGFTFGIIEQWVARQPQEALAWAASVLVDGSDFYKTFLDAARRASLNLDRNTLAETLPDGPGRAMMLDLVDASTNPVSLANRILALTDPAERLSQLRSLAKGWSNQEAAVEWARQSLNGAERTAFYKEIAYDLAHANPRVALEVLGELRGTDAYASSFAAMMRGLVQEGGQGQQAAELIANSDFNAKDRADLISELARRWVRQDADATIAWVNTLTAPEDFRAAIPLLVSQLDNDRVRRTAEAYLENHDPVMELALIEAAAPPGLSFDPNKSRLILDALIGSDPTLKIKAGEQSGSSKEEKLWNSVNQTARRQAEASQPATAMEWLSTLPFASQDDYVKVVGNVLSVWNLKSQAEAAGWLQTAALSPTIKADLQKAVQP